MRNIATLDAAPIRDPEGLQSTDCVLQVVSLPHFDAQMKGLECATRLGFVPPSVNRNCVTCKVCTCLLIFITLPLSKQLYRLQTKQLLTFFSSSIESCLSRADNVLSPQYLRTFLLSYLLGSYARHTASHLLPPTFWNVLCKPHAGHHSALTFLTAEMCMTCMESHGDGIGGVRYLEPRYLSFKPPSSANVWEGTIPY